MDTVDVGAFDLPGRTTARAVADWIFNERALRNLVIVEIGGAEVDGQAAARPSARTTLHKIGATA